MYFREPRKVRTFTIKGGLDCNPMTGLLVLQTNIARLCPNTCNYESAKPCLLEKEDPGISCTFHCDSDVEYTYIYLVPNDARANQPRYRLYDFIVD